MKLETGSSPLTTFADMEDWNAGLPEGATYLHDSMHFPYPLSPLTISLVAGAWSEGATRGFREVKVPLLNFHSVGRNAYLFQWMEFEEFTNPEAAQASGAVTEATMRQLMGRLRDYWETDRLPATQEGLNALRAIIAEVPASDRVPELVEETLVIFADLWRLHFTVVVPMGVAMQVFDEFHTEVFGGSEEDGHPLLAGQLTESVKAGFGLSDLAIRAKSLGLADVILDTEPVDAIETLAETEAGEAFLEALQTYLEDYGLRQDLFDVATPTWRERPAYALTNIRNYLRTGYDARAHHATIQAKADAAVTAAWEQLANYPQPVREQFEVLLKMGQDSSYLQEEHNFHLDQQVQALVHDVFREIGARLADSGAIAAADDVFMLNVEEIQAALDSPAPLDRVVSKRREMLERAWTISPPPFIGVPPAGPPPALTPADRGNIRFWGMNTPTSDDPGKVVGNPGARGQATGLARVVHTLEEASALEPGEILVTMTTMPPWSPLFGVAAGVVTETGGPLSHCAIVAREYEIPAVVGAPAATRRIVTGQRIRIDGTTGVVELDVED